MPTDKKDLELLSKLGQKAESERILEVFPNHSDNLQVICKCTEFTCYCPLTKQPDYAEITISYYPEEWVIESKSLKLYLESFRQEGVFHEHLAQDIADDIVYFAKPRSVEVRVDFNIRGGIGIQAIVRVNRDSS